MLFMEIRLRSREVRQWLLPAKKWNQSNEIASGKCSESVNNVLLVRNDGPSNYPLP